MATKHGDILIDNLDTERFSKDIQTVKEDKVYLEEISNKLTTEFSKSLDNSMQNIYRLLKANKMDDTEIEKSFLELTNLLYFMGDKLESLGIELTVSSARNQEIFNRLFQEAEGTIKDKQSAAEEGSKYEYLLKAVYESVYKRIKMKIDAGYEMVSTLKRIIMKRIAEIDLTKKASNYSGEGNGRKRSAYEGD